MHTLIYMYACVYIIFIVIEYRAKHFLKHSLSVQFKGIEYIHNVV